MKAIHEFFWEYGSLLGTMLAIGLVIMGLTAALWSWEFPPVIAGCLSAVIVIIATATFKDNR
jgi:hypothetical protein